MSCSRILLQRQHERHECAGDRRRARAAVCLDDVAVERDRPLAELFEPRDRAQRAADQALDLLRASADLARRRLALRARGRRARQHAVFGRHPALARVAAEGRHAVFDARGADHFRLAGFDEDGTFGVNQVVRRDAGGAELFRKTAV